MSWWEDSERRWNQQWWSNDQKWPEQEQWKQQETWHHTNKYSTREPASASSSSTTRTKTKQSATNDNAVMARKKSCLGMEWRPNRLRGLVVTTFKTLSAGHSSIVTLVFTNLDWVLVQGCVFWAASPSSIFSFCLEVQWAPSAASRCRQDILGV